MKINAIKINQIIKVVFSLILVFGCPNSGLFAQQELSLKQKLEQNIVKTQIFHEPLFLLVYLDKHTGLCYI
ncbi:MAG: hypothetical protein KKD05_07585 [Candidatus Omnitrophica bacterium]|nr:hypothetical protein [Candidatus Omnitrophota bacterium]